MSKQTWRDRIEGMKKQKTADRQLYTYDGKVEHIKYFENDSDPAYNQALDDIIPLVEELLDEKVDECINAVYNHDLFVGEENVDYILARDVLQTLKQNNE